jgi:uncharacterized protein YndB with AHSA1/START domain
MAIAPFNSELDLVLERVIDITPEQAFAAWTQPEHITKWFTPVPWQTPHAEIDLRPGGIFRTVMQGPDGESNDNSGCVLEVEPNRRLVWTGALGPGFRPNDVTGTFPFTAELRFEPADGGTKYTATAMHATAADCAVHAEMGFVVGWGLALDQLVAHMKSV